MNPFQQGQKIANQDIENKYGNAPLYNGGPGSGIKGHMSPDKKDSGISVKDFKREQASRFQKRKEIPRTDTQAMVQFKREQAEKIHKRRKAEAQIIRDKQ